MQREIDKFKKSIAPLRQQWKSIDLRIVAVAEDLYAPSSFFNVGTKVILLPQLPEEVKLRSDLPDTRPLRVLHKICPIQELDNILDELANRGVLRLEGLEVRYQESGSSGGLSVSFAKRQKGDRYTSSPTDWTHFSLFSGGRKGTLPVNIDEILRSQVAPYQDLQELLSDFTQLKSEYGHIEAGWVEIHAPVGIRISSGRLIEKAETLKLEVHIECMHSWNATDIDVGLICRSEARGIERRSEEAQGFKGEDTTRSSIELAIPRDVRSVTVILRTRRIPVDQISVFNPRLNARFTLYEGFDGGLEKLKTALSQIGERSEEFERAVESLLFICGYAVAPFVRELKQTGRMDIRGADGVVMAPDGSIFVVECTTGTISEDKLGKLQHRTQSLAGTGLKVHPVLFAATGQASVGNEVKRKAQNDRISIVLKKDIQTLLSMAEMHASAEEVSKYIYGCVPTSGAEIFETT